MSRLFTISAVAAAGLSALVSAAPSLACPSAAAVGPNFLSDPNVSATFVIPSPGLVNPSDSAYYYLSSTNESPSGGVPGLIEYCVYPNQPPGNPASATAEANGANGEAWSTVFKSIQGYFAFARPDGDPSNIPFDGTQNVLVGYATWPVESCTPTGYLGCPGAPTSQTILLHINDPAECSALYGAGSLSCFVYPVASPTPPPPELCNGNPACKSVIITEAVDDSPLTVPGNTLLHLQYTYVIVNQPTNTFNMYFFPPSPKTNDVNSGGGKDYFGCEQIPDPAGQPGAFSPPTYPNYQGTGFTLNFTQGSGACNQSRFTITAPGPGTTPIVLQPGQSITFTVNMVTRVNKGGHQEYTSCGPHLLNSGFTIKWFQTASTAGLMYSYSTNNTPIYVDVVSGGTLVCP